MLKNLGIFKDKEDNTIKSVFVTEENITNSSLFTSNVLAIRFNCFSWLFLVILSTLVHTTVTGIL